MTTLLADWLEIVLDAVNSLIVNKMRSALTMLGVIIGVAAVISLLSIGAGAQASITQRITSAGTNLITIYPGAPRERGVRGAPGSSQTLTYDDAQALANKSAVPDAQFVAPEYSRFGQIIFGSQNTNASVAGITAAYQQVFNLKVQQGSFITEEAVKRRAKVAVLGYQVAQDLFSDSNPIGQKIKFSAGGRKATLTVVGVLQEAGGSIFGSADDSVFVPISTAQMKLFRGRNPQGKLIVTSVVLKAPTETQVDAMQSEVETLLKARHNLSPADTEDFRIRNQADLLATASGVAETMTLFLGAIAAISLLVGGIGIMNIMLVSVTERTREIGLRKAVGARKGDILVQFLMEAVVLSALGGLIGILLGVAIAKIMDTTGVMTAVVTTSSILLAVGFSLAIGIFFGIYPANKASGLSPIEALRYE